MRIFQLGLAGTLAGLLFSCSMDVIPVHYSRIQSARSVAEPVARGLSAPGAFRVVFEMKPDGGYRWDPTEIEIKDGLARAKPSRVPSVLETHMGRSFVVLDAFREVPGPGHQGVLRYQLSPDSSNWFYFSSHLWKPAVNAVAEASTAEEISAGIRHFHAEAGSGSIYVRVFFVSPTGKEPVVLRNFVVEGIAPKTDGWN